MVNARIVLPKKTGPQNVRGPGEANHKREKLPIDTLSIGERAEEGNVV
jgi:hypothetical protein